MKAEIKDRWVAALRSGKYIQGTGYLSVKEGDSKDFKYCCLGVLCDLMGLEAKLDEGKVYRSNLDLPNGFEEVLQVRKEYFYEGLSEQSHLPEGFRVKIDLNRDTQSTLVDMNDGCQDPDNIVKKHNFAEIADYIEENIYGRTEPKGSEQLDLFDR